MSATKTVFAVSEWISWLETGLAQWQDPEDKENFLHEMIDKIHRRGACDEQTVFALHHHFKLVE